MRNCGPRGRSTDREACARQDRCPQTASGLGPWEGGLSRAHKRDRGRWTEVGVRRPGKRESVGQSHREEGGGLCGGSPNACLIPIGLCAGQGGGMSSAGATALGGASLSCRRFVGALESPHAQKTPWVT